MPNVNSADSTATSIDSNNQTNNAVAPGESGFHPTVSIPLTDSFEAFELSKAEINAYPRDRAALINTDIGVVTQNALWAYRQLGAIEADIRREASTYDITRIKKLGTLAYALNYVHSRLRLLKDASKTEGAQQLIKTREDYRSDIHFLIRHGYISPERLTKLAATNGHHAIAYDVIGYCDILLEHVDKIPTQPFWKRETLLETRRNADNFFNVMGETKYGKGAVADLKLIRSKIFAMLVELWTDLYFTVQYVRRAERDVDTLMPALYPSRPGRKSNGSPTEGEAPTPPANGSDSSPDEDDDIDDEEESDADPGVLDIAAINAAATRATNAAATDGAVPQGFPGARPLRQTDDK